MSWTFDQGDRRDKPRPIGVEQEVVERRSLGEVADVAPGQPRRGGASSLPSTRAAEGCESWTFGPRLEVTDHGLGMSSFGVPGAAVAWALPQPVIRVVGVRSSARARHACRWRRARGAYSSGPEIRAEPRDVSRPGGEHQVAAREPGGHGDQPLSRSSKTSPSRSTKTRYPARSRRPAIAVRAKRGECSVSSAGRTHRRPSVTE